MNSKGISIGLGVLALLGATTAYVYRPQPATDSAALTNPWTSFEAARVDRVILQRPAAAEGQRELEFEKRSEGWRMVRPGRGPTETRAVEELVERLSSARVVRIAGRSRSSYDTFGVDDAHGIKVTLKSGTNNLLELVVGETVDSGTAVRATGRDETFQIDQSIAFMLRREARDWRDRDVTRLARDTVRSVEWVNPNGTFRFTRSGDAWTAAEGTTVERLDPARVGTLVDTLANLRAADFAGEGDNAGIENNAPRVTLRAQTDAGESSVVLRLGASRGENERYLRREGSDVTFVVSRAGADAMNPPVTAFQSPADAGVSDAGAAPPPTPEPGQGAAPGGPPGGPGGAPGGMQLPPELLRQLQEQMRRQGAGGGGAPPPQ